MEENKEKIQNAAETSVETTEKKEETNTIDGKELQLQEKVETESKTEEEETIVKVLKEIHPAIVIMYGEFLGYVSPLLVYAEKICEGEKMDDAINSIIRTEAVYIFKRMQEDYSLDEIRGWYDDFYEVCFKVYDENIKNGKKTTPVVQTTTNSYPSRFDDYEDWD